MDFAAEIAKITAQLEVEAVATALGDSKLSEIRGSLRSMKSAHDKSSEDLAHVTQESIGRKKKIREELTPEIEKLQGELEEIKSGESDITKLNEELGTLRKFKTDTEQSQQKAFAGEFAEILEHPAFEKASKSFTLPALDGEGKIINGDDGLDFSKATPEQMAANVAKLSELKSVGLFDIADSEPDNNNKGPSGQRTTQKPTSFEDKVSGVKNMDELAVIARGLGK